MLWEMFQQSKIRQAQSEASQASKDATSASRNINSLESKIDHLALINRAMWSLIRQQTNLTERDLIERVKELDLEDGVHDNKYRETKECYNCGKVLGPKTENCVYCGVKIPIGNAFNKL